jgi:hypothetical protein
MASTLAVRKYILTWVPEGSLAVIFWCHEMTLEFVCGADFWYKRHCRTSPVVLEGFWGKVWTKIGRQPTRKFPARLPSGTQLLIASKSQPREDNLHSPRAMLWMRVPPAGR